MPYPPRTTRRTSYKQAEAAGAKSPDTANLDSELNDIYEEVDQINTRLRNITASDGSLKNLAKATAQSLAGAERFVAVANQTDYTTSVPWQASFSTLSVFVFRDGVQIDTSSITVADDSGSLKVSFPALAGGEVVLVTAYESGAGILTRLADTAAGEGADLVSIEDVGGLVTASTVEGALQEIFTALNSLAASLNPIAELWRTDGSNAPTANISMDSNKLTNLAPGTAGTDAVNVDQLARATQSLNSFASLFLRLNGSNAPTADIGWNSKKITNLANPSTAQDAATKDYVDTQLSSVATPIGGIILWPGSALPAGDWVLCDGGAYDRSTYAALFTALGGVTSPYGLPDGATFNVPDLRGRVPVGAGVGAGQDPSAVNTGKPTGTALTARTVGQWFGEERHTQTIAEMPSHNHGNVHGFLDPTAPTLRVGGATPVLSVSDNTGGGGPFNIQQPSLVMQYIIRRS